MPMCRKAPTYTTLGGGRLYSLPNNEACKPHLDAFLMSKHVNFYINPFVCLRNLWKTHTQKMPMWNGPNLYHIRWWETVQPTRQWSLQTTFGSLSNVQTWKSLHQSSCMLEESMKNTYTENAIAGGAVPTYTTLGGGRLYSLPNNEACKPHLEAFLMSKHVNFYINLFVCLTESMKNTNTENANAEWPQLIPH